jgi:hypothetical protein
LHHRASAKERVEHGRHLRPLLLDILVLPLHFLFPDGFHGPGSVGHGPLACFLVAFIGPQRLMRLHLGAFGHLTEQFVQPFKLRLSL